MNLNYPLDANVMHAFYNKPEVRDLLKQLNDGLLHPLEYADKIFELAYVDGLIS